jgi:hypothetical protein
LAVRLNKLESSGTTPKRAVPETGHGGEKMNIKKKKLTHLAVVEP